MTLAVGRTLNTNNHNKCTVCILFSKFYTLKGKKWRSRSRGILSQVTSNHTSDFIWDFGKLPFPTHLGKYFIKIGKIRAKIHEIGKIKAIFGLGMTPIYGLKKWSNKITAHFSSFDDSILT